MQHVNVALSWQEAGAASDMNLEKAGPTQTATSGQTGY